MAYIRQLREQRARLHTQAAELLKKGSLSAEDRRKVDAMMNEVDQLGDDIGRAERADGVGAELSETSRPPMGPVGADGLAVRGLAIDALALRWQAPLPCDKASPTWVQRAFTALKIAALMVLIGAAFLAPHSHAAIASTQHAPVSIAQFGIPMAACLMA